MKSFFNTFVELFPAVLSYLFSHLIDFIKRLFGVLLTFGLIGIISYGLAFLVPDLLSSYTPVSVEICLLIKRILFTLAPALPTVVYALGCVESSDESSDGFSIDLCFVVWILTAIVAWKFI